MSPAAGQGTLAIIAGGGVMPRRVLEACIAIGRPAIVVGLEGQTDDPLLADRLVARLPMGAAATILALLRRHGATSLVMTGRIRRPSLTELQPDWRAAQLFARIGLRALGDDGLLRAVAHELEAEGFTLVAPHELLDDATAPAGVLGRHRPDAQAEADLRRALEVALALGGADVGQGCVVQQGLVLAVEAIEGTDSMLARAGELRRAGLGGVLVKAVKPQQDRRLDLPVVGPATVTAAAGAGLRGIGVEAGGALILEQAETIAAADAAGLFLVGLER